MSTFKIAGKDFYQYVAYRLKKDGIGYMPSDRWQEGSTDTKTYIKAIMPQQAYHFLVYAHELGHCKSKQLPRSMGSSFFGYNVCDNTLQNEFNAWVWAIRYMRKLKMTLAPEAWVRALNDSFRSYTRKADNKRFANDLLEKLNDILGIDLEMESVRTYPKNRDTTTLWISPQPMFDFPKWTDIDWKPCAGEMQSWGEAVPAKPIVQNKKHRPWMDLMDKKRKKSWKHA